MPKSGRGCRTRNNISHQILATAPNQSRDAHTIAQSTYLKRSSPLPGCTASRHMVLRTRFETKSVSRSVLPPVRLSEGRPTSVPPENHEPIGRELRVAYRTCTGSCEPRCTYIQHHRARADAAA